MSMGSREGEQQRDLFVMHDRLPRSPGHVFYDKLNRLLRGTLRRTCRSHLRVVLCPGQGPAVGATGSLLPHAAGWLLRGAQLTAGDRLAVQRLALAPQVPRHPAYRGLTRPLVADSHSNRLPLAVHRDVFVWILALAARKKLLQGKTVAVDSTTLEANAAMRSIVRRDTGEDWNEFLTRLMLEDGQRDQHDDDRPSSGPPSRAELRKFDKARENKRVSNDEWASPTDPDSRITRMKRGTTHLAYKAEHVVDLDNEIIVAAEIYHADPG
jgi:transposase